MIYIDMPMPDNCVECRFSDGEHGFCHAMSPNFCGHVNDSEKDGRTEWCPLKDCEPRVMTLEEVRHTPYTAPLWLEWLEGECVYMALISPRQRYQDYVEMYTTDDDVGLLNYEMHMREDYNVTWRCWTSCPTDEQREAIPWG